MLLIVTVVSIVLIEYVCSLKLGENMVLFVLRISCGSHSSLTGTCHLSVVVLFVFSIFPIVLLVSNASIMLFLNSYMMNYLYFPVYANSIVFSIKLRT